MTYWPFPGQAEGRGRADPGGDLQVPVQEGRAETPPDHQRGYAGGRRALCSACQWGPDTGRAHCAG